MERFISRNKKTIALPVPLGTEIYIVRTKCGDFCMFQKEKFDALYPPTEEGRCSHSLLCHTKGLNPQKTELKIENIHILSEWGDRVFVNKDDAIKRTDEIVKENINKLRELGFYVDENGYGKEKD